LLQLPTQELRDFRQKETQRFRRLERAWARHKALDDFWFFLNFILKNPVLYEPLHYPLSQFVSNWGEKRKKLILLPRGHVKSNIITISYPLWCAVRDQDVRILIESHKDSDAKKFLRTIKSYIRNPRFQHFFPEIRAVMERGREKVWNDSAVLLVRGSTATENTFEISSLTSQVTGRHYTGIIPDDLVTVNNIGTNEQRAKTQEMHELSQSLLDPGGWEIVTGTRYHFADEYGRILEEDADNDQYEKMITPALYDISVIHEFLSGQRKWRREDDFEHLLYPSRYTLSNNDYISPDEIEWKNRKSLVALYKDQGPKTFANQYMMEPFDPATRLMHDGMLKEWDKVPEGSEIVYYRACDLSSPELAVTRDRAYTAILTVAVTPECDIILTDIFWGTYDGIEIINELIDGQVRHIGKIPKAVTMEKGPYEKSYQPFLFRAMRERQIKVPIRKMSRAQHQRAKDEHIEGIVTWVAAGKVGYVRGCKNIDILKEEMNKYPSFPRKDCLDALAQIPLLCFRKGSERFLQEMVQMPPEKTKAEQLREELNAPTVIRFGAAERDRLLAGSAGRLGQHQLRKNEVVGGGF